MDLLKQIKYLFNLKEYGFLKSAAKYKKKEIDKKEIQKIEKIDNTIEYVE